MSKYKDWKMIDWIITGIVAISFLSVPDGLIKDNSSTMVTVFDYPDNIPIIIAGVFLIYCFLSGAYWIINKKIPMVIHYCLTATVCITITMLYIIAYNSGM